MSNFMRGARPSPRYKLLATPAFLAAAAAPPPQFAAVPGKLSVWNNDRYGCCVTTEEAFAKAAYSASYCGLPETFITDQEVYAWAKKYGFLNGADLTSVMGVMAKDGLNGPDGVDYKDGRYAGVNYADEPTLQSAIAQGPVKIAIDADALPSGAGNHQGWYSTAAGHFRNTDHCVGLCGYGTAGYLFEQLKVAVPAGLDPATPGYLLFTWGTIGFVTHGWLMGTCTEAYVRTPTTPGQSPAPPPVPPTPPGPVPAPTTYRLSGVFTGDVVPVLPAQPDAVAIDCPHELHGRRVADLFRDHGLRFEGGKLVGNRPVGKLTPEQWANLIKLALELLALFAK